MNNFPRTLASGVLAGVMAVAGGCGQGYIQHPFDGSPIEPTWSSAMQADGDKKVLLDYAAPRCPAETLAKMKAILDGDDQKEISKLFVWSYINNPEIRGTALGARCLSYFPSYIEAMANSLREIAGEIRISARFASASERERNTVAERLEEKAARMMDSFDEAQDPDQMIAGVELVLAMDADAAGHMARFWVEHTPR